MSLITKYYGSNISLANNTANTFVAQLTIQPIHKYNQLNIKKNKMLLKKYGIWWKIIRIIQTKTALSIIRHYTYSIELSNDISYKSMMLLKFYKYVEYNIDAIPFKLYEVFIYKLIAFSQTHHIFNVYMYVFNQKCNIITPNGKICNRNCYWNFYQCKYHLHLKYKHEVGTHIVLNQYMYKPLIHIINRYVHEDSYSDYSNLL